MLATLAQAQVARPAEAGRLELSELLSPVAQAQVARRLKPAAWSRDLRRHLRVLLFLGLGSFAGMAVLFFLPTTWEVRRQRAIAGPPEAVYPWLADLRRWRQWSPWQESDYPGLVYRYAGSASGEGAEVSWDSDATGDGHLRIIEARPNERVRFEMRFQRGRIRAEDTLELRPLPGGGTEVTWVDRGDLGRTLLGRLSLPAIERSMGRDLERGLDGLARVVEGGAAAKTSVP